MYPNERIYGYVEESESFLNGIFAVYNVVVPRFYLTEFVAIDIKKLAFHMNGLSRIKNWAPPLGVCKVWRSLCERLYYGVRNRYCG